MAKAIEGYIKLQIPAGGATPAQPVGPALGQHGINIMDFCKQFNAQTQDKNGVIIPVVITVYNDKSLHLCVRHHLRQCSLKRRQVLVRRQANLIKIRLAP